METVKLIINFVIAISLVVVAAMSFFLIMSIGNEKSWRFYDINDFEVIGDYQTLEQCRKDEALYNKVMYGTYPTTSVCSYR